MGITHVMKNADIRRTGVSALTNEELLILDIAAIDGGRRRQYRHAVFSEQWNYPSHGFDDETLVQTLDRFETEGFVTSKTSFDRHGHPDRTVRLTEVGGSLWESERLPDWPRYVSDIYPRNRISIYGYSAETCQRYFAVACESGLVNYNNGRVITAVSQRRLIYWRPSQAVHLLCARGAELPGTSFNIDWDYFESHRSWWRFPNEIGTLWPTEGNSKPG